MNTQIIWDWINERHAIYLRKQVLEGAPIPDWANPNKVSGVKPGFTLQKLTDDPVLRAFRFCNAFRELDRVTIWIRENIRERYADHPNLWLMLAIARYINWPPTLKYLIAQAECGTGSWPINDKFGNFSTDPSHFEGSDMTWALETWAKVNKTYTGAYMIRAESDPNKPWYSWSKHRYIAEVVIGRLWEDRAEWERMLSADAMTKFVAGEMMLDEALPKLTLQHVWTAFQNHRYVGWGPFMAFEVVTDMRHTRYLRNAPDIMTWANAGPGALRGLNRLAGLAPTEPLSQPRACQMMQDLLTESREPGKLGPHIPQPLEMRDIEHALCEVDKWIRVQNGEGKPRAKYVPGRGY